MGPQEDYIETVLTCEGDYYDPDFHKRLENFKVRLQSLILADNGKLILKKVEPWNSVRVTFNIPKEAAIRLKQLAEQGDHTLRDLGILAVQIEGDRSISLKIAGKNNETTELVFRTSNVAPSVDNTTPPGFDTSSEDLMPGPPDLEATRANIVECLRAQSEAPGHLLNVFMHQHQQGAPSVTIPASHVNQTSYGSPSRSPSHSAFSAGSQLPLTQGKSPPGFPSPSQSVSQQSFPSPGSSRSQPSPVSPGYPTPPPSQPSHPGSPGIRLSLAYTHNNPTVNNVQGLRVNKDITSASPLLVNLLQTEVAQHVNNIQQSMPPPFDGGPPGKKRKRQRKRDKTKLGPLDGEIRVPGLPLPISNDSRVPPIGAGSESFMQQSPSPHGDGSLQGLTASLPASLSRPSTPSSQQAHSWVHQQSSPSPVPGTVTPPSVLAHTKSAVLCDKPAASPQHIINPYTGQLEPIDGSGLSADSKDFIIKTESSDTYSDVSQILPPPPNPLVAIQQHMAASENSGQQQHRVSSPLNNTSNSAGNSTSFLSGLTMPRLPPYSAPKQKNLHRSGSPANAGGVPVGVGSVALPGSTNAGSINYPSMLSGLKRSSPGLFGASQSAGSSQVPATTSQRRYSPVTCLTSVSGSSSLVSTVSSVLSGEKNHLPIPSAIPNSGSDSQNRTRSNCGASHAQNNISVTQGLSMIPSDRSLTVTSVASQVANVMSYPTKSENLPTSASLSVGASVSQGLQKSRNIHSQSPTASLSLSVSQTLSAYPDRAFPPSSLISGLDLPGSDVRPSPSTPFSSRSSTPKIKTEQSHDSVTSLLREAASHFRDRQETFPVKIKEEPLTKENKPEQPSSRAVQLNAAAARTDTLTNACEAVTVQASSEISKPDEGKLQTADRTAEVALGHGVTESVGRATSSLSHLVSTNHMKGNGTEKVTTPEAGNETKPGSTKENCTDIKGEKIPDADTNSGHKEASDTKVLMASNSHNDVGGGNGLPIQQPHQAAKLENENHVEKQHVNDANNCHDHITDRLFEGRKVDRLLDVPPLLNPHEGGSVDSVIHNDLQSVPRGSNGASVGEPSPTSSDNASSSGQPNSGQSPITNMIGHINHDSELSSHSFEDDVSMAAEGSSERNSHSGASKDRDNRPNQAEHKNIITVGYAFSKETPVDLNNGFANDKLFKNLNSMPFLTKPFLDLENSDVKGVRVSTEFLQKDRKTQTLSRQASDESSREKFIVKPSLITENHLNSTNCLTLPAKLMGKSDLNPGGTVGEKSDSKVNGSVGEDAVNQTAAAADHPSINGAKAYLPEIPGNGVLVEAPEAQLSADGKTEESGKDGSKEKPSHSSSASNAVIVISTTVAGNTAQPTNNPAVSKNESALPSSRVAVWAGSEMAPRLPASSEPSPAVEQSSDLILHTKGSNDNLASSRTVIMAACSAPVFTSETSKEGEQCRCAEGRCPISCHPQTMPSSMPSLIPADKPASPACKLSHTPVEHSSPVTSHADKLRTTSQTTVTSPEPPVSAEAKFNLIMDGLRTTPNGDHSGISSLLSHGKIGQTKGISILKPLHDKEEEGDEELLCTSPDRKRCLTSEPVLITGHATQDSPIKAVSQPNFVLSSMKPDDKLGSKDNLLRVMTPSKAPRPTYSKNNPKSSFGEFPNNSSRQLAGFVHKSIHTPTNHNTSQTITAPGFHLNLTESVQRVIPSMDTLSPPHDQDKATFSLPRVNQSPPAAEKKSPTQKLHSGKVTPEPAEDSQLKNDQYLAMNKRFHARTTASVVNVGSKSKTVTVMPPVNLPQTTVAVSKPVSPSLSEVVTVESSLVSTAPSLCSISHSSDATPTVNITTATSKSENKAGEIMLSGNSVANTSTALDCYTSGCLTVKANTTISMKLETSAGSKDSLEPKIKAGPVVAKAVVPVKVETSGVQKDSENSAVVQESKTVTELKPETSAKVEVVARCSKRLQAKHMEQCSGDHEGEAAHVRPARSRKYSTESSKSECSEVPSEGISTRSGRTRRASTESSKSVEEHGRSSRATRCNSRESTESRSASTESGHSKEESPKTMTRSRMKSESSEDHPEDRRCRLAEQRLATPSPTPRPVRSSTRSIRKKLPDGTIEEKPAPDSASKTRGSKRRLALDDEGPVEKRGKTDEAQHVDEASKSKSVKTVMSKATEVASSSVANRVRGKQDAKTPVKDPATKVSPSKENVAEDHSYIHKKGTSKAKSTPTTAAKKTAPAESKGTPANKTRQVVAAKSSTPELTGRRSGSKQQQVAEDKTITAAAPAASTAPATAAIKRSTRSMRAKDVAEPVSTPSAGKRRRISRDQR